MLDTQVHDVNISHHAWFVVEDDDDVVVCELASLLFVRHHTYVIKMTNLKEEET